VNKKKTISDDELRYLSSGIGVKAAYGPNDLKDKFVDDEFDLQVTMVAKK